MLYVVTLIMQVINLHIIIMANDHWYITIETSVRANGVNSSDICAYNYSRMIEDPVTSDNSLL